MKNLLPVALLSVALAGTVVGEEPAKEQPKVKIAFVNLNRITNNGGINYDRIRYLGFDKQTLDAIKKIDVDIQDLQKQVVDANDETTLQEISRKMQFLNQKSSLLRQRIYNEPGRDPQAVLRSFVVEQFKDKYAVILWQQDSGVQDRVLWKGDAEVVDITVEVQDKFREFLDQLPGGNVHSSYRYRPARSSAAPQAAKPVPPEVKPTAEVAKPLVTPATPAAPASTPAPAAESLPTPADK